MKSVKAAFPEEIAEMPAEDKPLQRILNLWVKDVNAGKSPGYANRQPGYIFLNYEKKKLSIKFNILKNQRLAYGLDIDDELYKEVMNQTLIGVTVDAHTLRELLTVILLKHEKSNLLEVSGSFGSSWAQRFFKRQKNKQLSQSLTTEKMIRK